jgi:alkylation response protein AidB-like acyl-CoA dehydrogenase
VILTTEQRDLRDAVRGLLARYGGAAGEAVPGQPLWQRLCGEIGVAGLAIPQRYGGAGAGPPETGVVMAELGRELVTSPMLGSAVLAAGALLAAGDEAACQRLLPAIAGGTVAALAWTGQEGRWDPAEPAFRARRAPGGWALEGEAHYVLDGDAAGILLAAARTADGTGLFEVDPAGPGVSRAAVATMDQTRRLAVVRLAGAAGQRIREGGAGALARARDLACAALAAEQAGAAARALELTVAYSKQRVQFGRPIGSFQALQHRMAHLHVLAESAGALAHAAASAAAAGEAGLLAAAAKAYCSEALQAVAAEMIQIHGAIGITWEHAAHRYLKRAHGAAFLLGRPADHAARIAAAVLEDGALADRALEAITAGWLGGDTGGG